MTLVLAPDPEAIKLWTDHKSFHHKINRPVTLTFGRGAEKIQGPTALVRSCRLLQSSSRFITESS